MYNIVRGAAPVVAAPEAGATPFPPQQAAPAPNANIAPFPPAQEPAEGSTDDLPF